MSADREERVMSVTKLLQDIEHDQALELAIREIAKYKRLLARYTCNCKRFTLALPVDPQKHAPHCHYRKVMQ
jgi:hypothetical protein